MQELAIVYGILAWLGCWDIDLAVRLLPGPLTADLVLKFVVVTVHRCRYLSSVGVCRSLPDFHRVNTDARAFRTVSLDALYRLLSASSFSPSKASCAPA